MSEIRNALQEAVGDRYRVERELGQGGMATVFLATDLKHDRPVALKVLKPNLAASLGSDRFLREIEIAARLQHPNILPVYDSGAADGVLYYVMPYVEGESLHARLGRGPLPTAEAVRLARQIADALDYAHRLGVVHRDIKPANILLSQGNAVVADFGIARALDTSGNQTEGMTQAGMAIGTPTYMSPEQALGSGDIDGRSDIYALGVVLYEMCQGAPPFRGTTPQAIVAQALSGDVPALDEDQAGLGSIVARAMAKEPEDRFRSGAAFRDALDGLSTGVTPGGRPRRPRTVLAWGTVLVLAALGAVLWSRGRTDAGNPRRSLIIFPFENRTGDPSRDYLSEAAMNLLGLAASHWVEMRVYDDERTASLLRRAGIDEGTTLDFDDARRLAREAKVGTLIVGDIRREGDSLAVEAKIHDVATGDRLATHIVRTGLAVDPRPLFDELAGLILGTSGAPPGERPSVLAQTTSSIEAYQAYLEGTAALQRFQIDTAIALLERAVGLDSTFALPYLRLRDAEGWSGDGGTLERRRRFVLEAERNSIRLPLRLRSLVAFHRAYEDGHLARAREVARGMIERDSTDVEAWYQYGETHYHHDVGLLPHDDSLGNLGKALNAFRRTLELDSTYTLAYQHTVDAWTNCAVGANWICLTDSAVYGTPDELARAYGEDLIRARREQAKDALLGSARGWVAAAPTTPRARTALIRVLSDLGRYDEALVELQSLADLQGGLQATFWKSMLEFRRGAPARAAAVLDSGLAEAPDSTMMLQGLSDWGTPGRLLAGGGRLDAASRFDRGLTDTFLPDTTNGPGGLRMGRAMTALFMEGSNKADVGLPEAGAIATEMVMHVRKTYERDLTSLSRTMTSLGSYLLNAYLASRDTTLLAALLARADTAGSATWHVADALLALARRDTALARLRVERHLRDPEDTEFVGEQGFVRVMGWADILTQLGDVPEALELLQVLDTIPSRESHPGLLVRSWAERGALYQSLGNKAAAADMYQRFVEAWGRADPSLEPAVRRAREALEALRGEVQLPVAR